MAVKQVYLSAAGADAEAYAKVNKKALTFLHFGIGSGENPSPENCEMINEKYTMPISTLKEMGDGIFKIRGVFSNENLTEDFIYRELALYIKDPKNESQTILYCYGNAKTAQGDYTETIPAFSGSGNKINRLFDIDIRVTGGSATFEIDDSAKADVATVQEIRDDLTAETAAREEGDAAAKNLANATGTLAIKHGGTGATTAKGAQYQLLGNMEEVDTNAIDDTYFLGAFAGASETKGIAYKRKGGTVWEWIKSKISSVLGLTATSYSGKAATAGTADTANVADISKATISSQVAINEFDSTKPYALLASYSDHATQNNDINYIFYAVREHTGNTKDLFIMRINGRWTKTGLGGLRLDCLYTSTGYTPPLTLTYKYTAGTDIKMELYAEITSNWQQWRIIPIISSSGDYGANALHIQKWTYRTIKDNGAKICVATTTANCPDVVNTTNAESPVIHGKADGLTKTLPVAEGGTGATTAKGAQNNLLTMSESTNAVSDSDLIVQKYTSPTEATGTLLYKKASSIWTYIQSKISSVLGLTATAYGGKAATAGTADTAKALSATYIKGLSISGKTITYTKGDNTTGTLTTQDTNTTYNAATQSAAGLMSAADKTKLDGITAGASSYTHPTTSGNKHIPSGGANNQVLGYSADGTAQWASRYDMIHTCSTAYGTTAKTIDIQGFKLQVGACIKVCFTYGNNSTSPTLNVSNTGAKEIRVQRLGGSIVPFTLGYGGRGQGSCFWEAGTVLELMYNGTYWVAVNNPIVKMSIEDDYMTKASSSETYTGNSYKVYLDGYKEQWGRVKRPSIVSSGGNWDALIDFNYKFYDKNSFYVNLNASSSEDKNAAAIISHYVVSNADGIQVQYKNQSGGQVTTPVFTWNAKGY